MKKRALFIDRDGVINLLIKQKDDYFDSPQNLEQIKLIDGVVDVISFMNKIDTPVIEVSNQPGVAKGKMDFKLLDDIENKIHSLLNEKGGCVTKAYYCFHHPNATDPELKIVCDCRKPKSGLLVQAKNEYNLDLSKSVILGDKVSDMEAGKNVGCTTILFSHKDHTLEELEENEKYEPDFRVYSHTEIIPILKKIFI